MVLWLHSMDLHIYVIVSSFSSSTSFLWFLFFLKDVRFLQVHIAQRGAVRPLIEMLQSADVQLREMSAFALGRLAQVILLEFFYFLFKLQLTNNTDGIKCLLNYTE